MDHLVVTGDLTFSGEPREFERAADLLRPFADAKKLTVVPGNHDVWTEESVETARFLRAIGPDGRGMRKAAPSYPQVVALGDEAVLLALDSARYGDDPFETPGRLGSDQLRSARELTREHSKQGRAVLLAFHHHVVLPPERMPSDAKLAHMPLADADQIVRLVAELPVAAVLHGHRHTAFRVDLPGAAGATPVAVRRLRLTRRRRAGAPRPRVRLRGRPERPAQRRGPRRRHGVNRCESCSSSRCPSGSPSSPPSCSSPRRARRPRRPTPASSALG